MFSWNVKDPGSIHYLGIEFPYLLEPTVTFGIQTQVAGAVVAPGRGGISNQ